MKKATLKQIADMAGVSLTTVHRALNGKGGCSKELEEYIQRIAQEQGYTTNLAAASLRRPPANIALIFPFRDNGGRYALDQILDGYLEYRRELNGYNIVFQEFLLRSSDVKMGSYQDMEYPELENVLQQIYMEHPVRYDGVVIYGMSVTRKTEALLNRIVGRGTRVVVLERILPSLEDTCTVKADSVMAGNMAGEMFSKGLRDPGTVAVISQLVPGGDPSAESCMDFLKQERPDLKTVELPLVMNVDLGGSIAEFLNQYPDLVGVYATSGRHTKSLLDAIAIMKKEKLVAIGSELFAESHQALHDRRLSALLDKRPSKIGYMALHLLIDSIAKNEPAPALYLVPPRVILRSNCDVHYVKREYQHESDQYCD